MIFKLFNWRRCLVITLLLLPVLIIMNFYGLYSNKFYFLNLFNYLLPLVAILHLVYLYVFWFKMKEKEFPDPQMRNLEYATYLVIPVYGYELVSTVMVLSSNFEGHYVPGSFYPLCFAVLTLQFMLLVVTLITFLQRKRLIGVYNVDYLDEKIDEWPGPSSTAG